MSIHTFFKSLTSTPTRRRPIRRCPPASRLRLEALEDRCLLSGVRALFDLGSPAGGPFASDRFTVADPTQNTGRRVNLPLPDPLTNPSDYQDTQVLNTLDGFNLQPRLSIPFDGPIDVHSVTSQTVFLVSLGDTLNHQDDGGQVVGINQVVWDPPTNTLHVESDQLLDQHTRYALIVTQGIHDADGQQVEPSDGFARFRHDLNLGQSVDSALQEYRKEMLDALQVARGAGVAEMDIVTASVFTTMSATAVLEKMRDQLHAATPAPADFLLGSSRERTLFNLDDVSGLTWNQQTRVNGPLNPVPVNVNLLRFIPGTVGQIAFGKYVSPDYETAEKFIPPVGTHTGTPVVQGVNEVFFSLYLPSGPMPAGGWPVAIFGHGSGGSKQGGGPGGGDSLALAASLAEQGIATIAINVVGHGFGPLSTLTVKPSVGAPVTFLEGGRGIDQNGDGIIGNNEGISAAPPRSIIRDSDGHRQTVADLMQLVRVIEVGMDVDGNGLADLDPARIYYLGQSLGGIYGTEFLAVEPSVHVGVLNVAGGSGIESNRLSTVFRAAIGTSLASRTPSLLNGPGITSLDGVPVPGSRFDENLPLRDGVALVVRLADGTERVLQSPVINTVPGAMPIQEVIEHTEWVAQSGNPVAYAPHLRRSPLAGIAAKSVIYQFAKGDQIVPNPATTAILRAGALADRATFYRHDLAFAENPQLPTIPHGFLTRLDIPGFRAILQGAQQQIATFFATDGAAVIHPEPARFFETPISLPLPENLNYILPPGPGGATAEPPARVESVVVNDGAAQRSMVDSLTVTFDHFVILDPGAFGLQREDGSEVGLNVAASLVGGRTVAILTFSGSDIIGGSLADGSYTLTVRADRAHDRWGRELDGDGNGSAGGDRVDGFFRLFGDTDGDREVDHADLDIMLSSFHTSRGDAGFLWFLDYDGDGSVGGLDMAQFNQRRRR
jgi:Bacterial virulence factor lipase N-terminal